MQTRINKRMADLGLASRREADELIRAGLVFVNGKKAALGDLVEEIDTIEVKKNKFSPASHKLETRKYFLYNKPRGIATEDIAHTLAQALPNDVLPVGRLDKASEGLILLSSDRRVPKRLLEPEFDHEKEYEVTVNKPVTQTFLNALSRGVALEDFKTKTAKVRKTGDTSFKIILTEGKHHQIRRMCDKFGFSVTRLVRVRIMNLKLTQKAGVLRELNTQEQERFLTSLKL